MAPGCDVPLSWVALETLQDWRRVSTLGGCIVISDDANDAAEGGPKVHHRGCGKVTLKNFTEKVLDASAAGRRPNGRYWWVARETDALAGGARRCWLPDDPLNAP